MNYMNQAADLAKQHGWDTVADPIEWFADTGDKYTRAVLGALSRDRTKMQTFMESGKLNPVKFAAEVLRRSAAMRAVRNP